MKYCKSYTKYTRFPSHEVQIGKLKMGAKQPIIVQSMINTNTMDSLASVAQIKELHFAGCQLIRATAQGLKEAENLRDIKTHLQEDGLNIPLVADIHFAPKVADLAATIVEKVRINPGNYIDKKNSKTSDYTAEEYQQELLQIETKFIPFLNICKKHNTAIRIGSNHGSLSDRIINKYGNTPEGVVEAAMEFLRICQKQQFTNVVVSMKASNTQVMMQSNRLLVAKMLEENMSYPIHLGVTEAGNGEIGRIKSAIGIGALLTDGIGDTIRVSLTEHPKLELPVAQTIIEHYTNLESYNTLDDISITNFNPYQYSKRKSLNFDIIGDNQPAVVVVTAKQNIQWNDEKPDFIFIDQENLATDSNQNYLLPIDAYRYAEINSRFYPYTDVDTFLNIEKPISNTHFVECNLNNVEKLFDRADYWNIVFVFNITHPNSIAEQRSLFFKLKDIKNPVILKKTYSKTTDLEVHTACDLGPMFIDGFGDGIWIDSEANPKQNASIAFNILQGARVRMSKTEFISCPSCGRTLFDLESTTENIKQQLSHLKHLKIGIMGCIVNGPGEMADADYGYVGAGAQKISLYKGQELVRNNIPSEKAVDELILLIKENGDWREIEHENSKK